MLFFSHIAFYWLRPFCGFVRQRQRIGCFPNYHEFTVSVDHLAGGPCPKDDHCRIGTFAGRGIAGSYNQLATRSVAIANSPPCSTACSICG